MPHTSRKFGSIYGGLLRRMPSCNYIKVNYSFLGSIDSDINGFDIYKLLILRQRYKATDIGTEGK